MNTHVTVEKEIQTGHFYKIKLHLVSEIYTNTCMDSVAVLCTIGNDEMVVHNNSFSTCPGNLISYCCIHSEGCKQTN